MKERLAMWFRVGLALLVALLAALPIYLLQVRTEKLSYILTGEVPSFWGPVTMAIFCGLMAATCVILFMGMHQNEKWLLKVISKSSEAQTTPII